MSSAGQATSSPTSNIQLIVNALADYAKITGVDLSENPFAAVIEQSNSPEAILELLQERAKAFKEYRDDNHRLINCLTPAVKVIQAFSGILGEEVTLVPLPLANALFVGIDVLFAAATRVTSSYDALFELFECLGSFLKRLEICTMVPPTPIMTEVIIKVMIELLSVLTLGTKQLKQGRFKKFAKKLLGESEIEAVLQRLDRLTRDETRIAVTQTLGVVHGLVGSVKVVMEDGKASTDNIRQYLVTLHQTLNEINKTQRDQLQKDVQHWLSPPDPSTNQSFVGKARHKGTAAWFFESGASKEWRWRGSLLWIHGKPGSGKSTLLSAIIQDIERMHAAGLATMAYYYFDFRDVKKQDCYGLLSSLISQLAAESNSCYNVLSQLYRDNSRGIRKPSISALKKCLKDMLSLPGQGPIYIIVDALDECPNSGIPSARMEVLYLIKELADLNLPNVYLCMASRPEMDIRMVLEPTSLQISLQDESGQKKDIFDYISYVVYSDRRVQGWREEDRQLVVDTLSGRSDGHFRLVACQVDRLCGTLPAIIRRVLSELPETLDETYEDALLEIDKPNREYAQRLFQCLAVSIRPLRVEELAEIFAVRFDEPASPTFNATWRPDDAKEAVISLCSALISIVDMGGHQVVQFSHFSVKEYLTSERLALSEGRLSCYHILPEPAHTTVAHACLSVLLQLDDMIDRNTMGRFPLAPYAARHWVDHAQFMNVSSHVQEAMQRLFDPANPYFTAWVWLYDIDRYWIEPMSTTNPTQPDAGTLYYASLCGFRDLVGFLIAADSLDVSARGGSHMTPLHVASVKGHLEVASLLLECGADPNSRDDQGRTPLGRALQGGHLDIARLLLDCGSDVNVCDVQGRTSLHHASRYGHFDLAWLLIDRGAVVSALDDNGWTPFHMALHFGHLHIAEILQDRGINVDIRSKNEETSWYLASSSGELDAVRFPIEHVADIHARDKKNCHLVHTASYHGYLDVVRLLIDTGTPIDIPNGTWKTPLALASWKGEVKVGRFLVERGADLNARDKQNRAPLHFAAQYGHPGMVRLLFEHGIDVNVQKDNLWSPLHLASAHGHLMVVQLLVQLGARVNVFNARKDTPLLLAAGNGKVEIASYLIDHGAICHTTNRNGWTPLHAASRRGHLGVVELLLRRGANVDMLNKANKTAAELASENGQAGIAKFIADYKADGNDRSKVCSTTLGTVPCADEDEKDEEATSVM